MSVIGNIHSLESFGTVDGPGIRFVTFMQGCPLRCLYCHNPDTWDRNAKTPYTMTPEELIKEVLKYKNFIAKGGVTVTGGEPLMQAEFVKEFFKLCKEEGLHTALDTSGVIFNETVKDVLNYTDLVLLDMKGVNRTHYKQMTGCEPAHTLQMLDYLEEKRISVWIRYVVVPGYTDKEEYIISLANLLTPYTTVQKVEFLPYHIMGTTKYEQMGLEYKLKEIPPMSKEQLEEVKKIFRANGNPEWI